MNIELEKQILTTFMNSIKSKMFLSLTVMASLWCFSAPALSQDPVIGQEEYRLHCAACHGLDGRGDGPIGALFKVAPPNLSMIAQRNGGKYPLEKVYNIIDGTYVTAAHGTRDMPLWADRYKTLSKPQTPDQVMMASDQVQQRILSLVYYLGTLQ